MAEPSGKTNIPMIKADKLSKFYGSFVAIKDVSFSIPKGQIVAFLGPNGAGKSTTMKILTGYLSPSEGVASIAGIDVHKNRLEASKHVGYLPENGPLYSGMTPMELLRFFGEVRSIPKDDLENRIDEVINQCALKEVVDKPISKLSRGFRQRVCLAQALLHNPEILIMDEPTSGLDPNQIRDFRENIRKLGESKTILISTHILQEVKAVADRAIIINEGQIVFDGNSYELGQGSSIEESFYELTKPDKTDDANNRGALNA